MYSFTEEKPGEVSGDGFSDAFGSQKFTWHVLAVGKTAGSSNGGGEGHPYGMGGDTGNGNSDGSQDSSGYGY